MHKSINKRRKGFTLIELIVVMAILAILVLLAVPKLLNYTKEAQATQIKNDVKVVEGKLEEYLIRNNSNMPEGLEVIEKSEVESKVTQDMVHDVRGLVSSVEGNEFHKLKDTQRSKLKGNFIANEDGKVYYIHTKAINNDVATGDDGESEGCPSVTCNYEIVNINPETISKLSNFIENGIFEVINGYLVDGEVVVFLNGMGSIKIGFNERLFLNSLEGEVSEDDINNAIMASAIYVDGFILDIEAPTCYKRLDVNYKIYGCPLPLTDYTISFIGNNRRYLGENLFMNKNNKLFGHLAEFADYEGDIEAIGLTNGYYLVRYSDNEIYSLHSLYSGEGYSNLFASGYNIELFYNDFLKDKNDVYYKGLNRETDLSEKAAGDFMIYLLSEGLFKLPVEFSAIYEDEAVVRDLAKTDLTDEDKHMESFSFLMDDGNLYLVLKEKNVEEIIDFMKTPFSNIRAMSNDGTLLIDDEDNIYVVNNEAFFLGDFSSVDEFSRSDIFDLIENGLGVTMFSMAEDEIVELYSTSTFKNEAIVEIYGGSNLIVLLFDNDVVVNIDMSR